MTLHEPMSLPEQVARLRGLAPTPRMPALFIGHGSPMNAITDNGYRAAWRALGARLPRPRAILCVSAHWQTRGTAVTTDSWPATIHDFGGFPQALFDQSYPAPGAPDYAQLTRELFPTGIVNGSTQWGLDHGAWCVLQGLFPDADVPVYQFSLDTQLDSAGHYAIAKQLTDLRERGVLVLGSGNIVHNLRLIQPTEPTPAWAQDFDAYVRDALLANDDDALIHYERAGQSAPLAVPTDEHYLPLLYVAAVKQRSDKLTFFTDDFAFSSLSMRSFMLDT